MAVASREPSMIKVIAGDVFNTFHVVAPDGDAFIPPCFVMAAAHEMGYCPTAHYLQQVVSVTSGWSGRMTYPLFLQMCGMLEGTRVLDGNVIRSYTDAFDVRGTGELSRTEFRIILATSAPSELTSCEAEAIINLLDPCGTNVIKLRDLEELLTTCLSAEGEPADPIVFPKRSSGRSRFLESSRASGQDFVPRSTLSGTSNKGRKTVVAEPKIDDGSMGGRGVPLHATAPRSPSASTGSNGRQAVCERGKREPSPVPTTLEALVSSQERTSRGIAAPKTTAPSPCLTAAVTRAASVAHYESPLSPVLSTNPGYTPPPLDGSTETPHTLSGHQQGSPEFTGRIARSDPRSTATATSLFPAAGETTRGPEGIQDHRSVSNAAAGQGSEAHATRRTLSIPSLEDMRDVSTENSRGVSHRSNGRQSGDIAHSGDSVPCRSSGRSVGTSTGPDVMYELPPSNQKRCASTPCCAMF